MQKGAAKDMQANVCYREGQDRGSINEQRRVDGETSGRATGDDRKRAGSHRYLLALATASKEDTTPPEQCNLGAQGGGGRMQTCPQ